jgi:hypothetical protein
MSLKIVQQAVTVLGDIWQAWLKKDWTALGRTSGVVAAA